MDILFHVETVIAIVHRDMRKSSFIYWKENRLATSWTATMQSYKKNERNRQFI